jgi:hypothetical protein
VLVHGDSHYFEVDKPLRLDSGKVLGNFTGVETFGAASTDWVQPLRHRGRSGRVRGAPRIGRRMAATDIRLGESGQLRRGGQRLENVTRVEAFGDNQANGDNDVHWVKALVDPQSRDVFAFQAQIVPANRTAVPAP